MSVIGGIIATGLYALWIMEFQGRTHHDGPLMWPFWVALFASGASVHAGSNAMFWLALLCLFTAATHLILVVATRFTQRSGPRSTPKSGA